MGEMKLMQVNCSLDDGRRSAALGPWAAGGEVGSEGGGGLEQVTEKDAGEEDGANPVIVQES